MSSLVGWLLFAYVRIALMYLSRRSSNFYSQVRWHCGFYNPYCHVLRAVQYTEDTFNRRPIGPPWFPVDAHGSSYLLGHVLCTSHTRRQLFDSVGGGFSFFVSGFPSPLRNFNLKSLCIEM